MSKKSLIRQQRQEVYRSPVLTLHEQKEHIRITMRDALGLACFLLMIILICVVITFTKQNIEDRYAIGGLLVISSGAVFFAFWRIYIHSWKAYRILQNIQYISEESVTIRCKKVYFLLRSISKHSSVIACMCLRDTAGKTYYYVYPKDRAPWDGEGKYLRRQLKDKELQLTLYQGTAAIMKMPTIQTNKEV